MEVGDLLHLVFVVASHVTRIWRRAHLSYAATVAALHCQRVTALSNNNELAS